MGKHCDVRAENIETAENGTQQRCTIVSGERRIPVHIPAYGTYMVYAALAAASVGMALGLTDEEIIRGIREYKTVGHRSRIVPTAFGILVDDCYNANPNSNRAAIDSLANLPGRKVCILRDMLECDVRYLAEVGLNRHQRVDFLSALMAYYSYHLDTINSVQSIRILQELF
jgi:UDP-N-acetylmuramyl pentapeptide synthase